MSSILWIEDNSKRVARFEPEFVKAGHTLTWVDEPSDADRYDKTRTLLLESRFDFLLLDINLEDRFGGIHLYNKLVAGEFRQNWNHTLVWSRYTGPRIKEAQYGVHEFPIRIFAETAGIPIANVLNANSGGVAPALKRISEMRSLAIGRCYLCGVEPS